MHVIRVATQNIWRFHGDWPNRRTVLADGLRSLQPDLIVSAKVRHENVYAQLKGIAPTVFSETTTSRCPFSTRATAPLSSTYRMDTIASRDSFTMKGPESGREEFRQAFT